MLDLRTQCSFHAAHPDLNTIVRPDINSDLVSFLDFTGIASRSVVRRECFPRINSHNEVL